MWALIKTDAVGAGGQELVNLDGADWIRQEFKEVYEQLSDNRGGTQNGQQTGLSASIVALINNKRWTLVSVLADFEIGASGGALGYQERAELGNGLPERLRPFWDALNSAMAAKSNYIDFTR